MEQVVSEPLNILVQLEKCHKKRGHQEVHPGGRGQGGREAQAGGRCVGEVPGQAEGRDDDRRLPYPGLQGRGVRGDRRS